MNEPVLQVRDLRKHFPIGGGLFGRPTGAVKAVDGVSFDVARNEVLGLVGESGSGKSTIGRAIVGLSPPTSGSILFEGMDLGETLARGRSDVRRRVQMVFQDPYSSLNPRQKVEDILEEGPAIHRLPGGREEKQRRTRELLDIVKLPASAAGRYPHEFSGGQRQRIGIARALSVSPTLIIADEAVSALDVSVQAQVVNLLEDLKEGLGLTLVFIAHDLSIVQHISDRVAVLYLGRVMEIASSDQLFSDARHPYSRALLSGMPGGRRVTGNSRMLLKGEIPSPINPPSGCVFRTRCPHALPACTGTVPVLQAVAPGHQKACIRDDI
jgi:oligopeptide transport system ATP-binding protein